MDGGLENFEREHKIPLGPDAGGTCVNSTSFSLSVEDETGYLNVICEDCDLVVGRFLEVGD